MAQTATTRFKLPQWSAGADSYPGRTGWNAILKLLEDQAALVYPSGPIASRPGAGTFGRFFLATDQGTAAAPASRLYYDGGSGWVELNTNGGGGAGRPILIGGTAAEGSSNRSARADHTHSIPMASTTTAGAMSAPHYDLVNGASVTTDPGMLVLRTMSGNVAVPSTPVGSTDATSKNYVDLVAGTHLPNPSTLVRRFSNGNFRSGLASNEDDVTTIKYIDSISATSAVGSGGKIMRRWASGVGANVEDPDGVQATANKRYVDGRASRRAWKENPRPLPYGLAEVVMLARKTKLYDYKGTDEAPLSVRGEKNHLGAYVEDVHKIMPLLTVAGEDGRPERITDREMIWPAYVAVAELEQQCREKDARIAALVSENATLNDRLSRVEAHLGL